MARNAPYWPQTFTGDGTTTEFLLGFPILDPAHLRVTVAGVLKAMGTDYFVETPAPVTPAMYTSHIPGADTSKYKVRFATAPTNAASIKFYRNTPIARPSSKVEVGPETSLYAHYRQQERDDRLVELPFIFNATDLAAHTSQVITAPCDGYITSIETDVTETVTTGGTVGANVESTAVAGMVVTVANSAAVGKQQTATPTTAQSATTKVKAGQQVSVTAASFASAGALRGRLWLQPADLAS